VSQWRKRFQYYKQCGYKIERSTGAESDSEEEEIVAATGCLVLDD